MHPKDKEPQAPDENSTIVNSENGALNNKYESMNEINVSDKAQLHEEEKNEPKFLQSFISCFEGIVYDFRTADRKTWERLAKIGLFYLVFYSVLAAFFAILMAIFFVTVDDNHPKWSGLDSRLKNNPGLGFQPMPDHLSTLIRFKSGAKSTYKIYTDYLHAYLLQYDNDAAQQGDSSNIISCDGGRSSPDESKVCQFKKEVLTPCIAENEFGYNKGEPCVLLKLNKVYGWKPANDTVVEVICEGQNPSDKDNMGKLKYVPTNGFPPYYFPFKSQQNYMSPLVMVQFTAPNPGVLLMVECRAIDANIEYNRQLKQGSVRFEILVD